jgi:hypothetical protein
VIDPFRSLQGARNRVLRWRNARRHRRVEATDPVAAALRREAERRPPAPPVEDLTALAEWIRATARRHAAYREAQLRHGALTDEVTVICATARPHHLDDIVTNFERQRHPARRLVVVTNHESFDPADVRERLSTVDGATSVTMPPDASLGTCLNAALDLAPTRLVAKFDDDDRYGPEYLGDLLLARRFSLAAVVGKHSHFACFDDGSAYLRFPGREFEHTSWLAGGTLLVDRERVGDLRFEDRSLGEDGALLRAVQRAGGYIYAADRFNYVQRRHGANTWRTDRDAYLRGAVAVDAVPEEIEC